MIHNYLSLCLFVISTRFVAHTVAREAIFNGFPVSSYQFPFQVSVQIHGYGHVCGGGIIGNRFILTAAHCLLNRTRHLRSSRIFVLAGTYNLNSTGPPAVIVRVEKVFFPKEFHPTVDFSFGDIAVLKLVDSLKLEHRLHLQKLQFPRTYNHDSFIYDENTIAGFGWNSYFDGISGTDGRLTYVRINVLSNEDCERAYPTGVIHSDLHFCAKTRSFSRPRLHPDRVGVCTGDDGGPLVGERTDFPISISQYDNLNYDVVGIISRIPDFCNDEINPAVYTRVAHYAGMILNVMRHDRDSRMISLCT